MHNTVSQFSVSFFPNTTVLTLLLPDPTVDCDANQDCYGPLECFQRDRQNPFEPVPGCDGEGEKGADYCYVPDGVRLPTPTTEQLPVTEEKEVGETTIGFVQGETVEYGPSLSDTTRTCSIHAPCLECEGDCDSGKLTPHFSFLTQIQFRGLSCCDLSFHSLQISIAPLGQYAFTGVGPIHLGQSRLVQEEVLYQATTV